MHAWVGEPLCALPEYAFEQGEDDNDGAGMCAPPRLHLLRNPNIDGFPSMSGRETPKEAPVVAARALARAREFEDLRLYEDALLNLRVVEANMPRVADHIALMRAAIYERLSDPVRAARAYREALDKGGNHDLVARAQVGYVENLLRAHDKDAERELEALLRRYPELPEAPNLRLEHAIFREESGKIQAALATYRSLDLTYPGYPVAKIARDRMAALAERGVKIPPYTPEEALGRAERLIKSGPIELAREVVGELAERPMPRALHGRREALLSSMDEMERKFNSPAVPASSETMLTAMSLSSVADAEIDPAQAALEKRLRSQIGTNKTTKLRPQLLLRLLYSASEARLTDVADELVRELTRRAANIPAQMRFDALAAAAGTASDIELVALADTLLDAGSLGYAARYHRARALERLGRIEEAKAEHTRVMELDMSPLRFYGLWAEQRLRALTSGHTACDAPGRRAACNQQRIEAALRSLETKPGANVDAALARLVPIAEEHGEAYPWLWRAVDLLRIGEVSAASDELYQTYLTYLYVARRGALRAGRQAVYRGAPVFVPTTDPNLRRKRLLLADVRTELAQVASDLGDHGTATSFGGPGWAESHPQPYADEVARVARKYGLDPDLLFAVMRVESVYQRRIISHAGAIGLMQIMPRTGRLIADKLGQYHKTTTDLLDPRTNLEFSAWYLRSLIERMDGRLPLAIAGYNGGPHNVRKWIRNYGQHVPLDAFLERIPFRETRRYVRRVLGYYARYKAERGEKVDLMAVTLPGEQRSEIAF